MLFKASVSLLIFCKCGVKISTISPFMFVKISFMYLGVSLWVAYIFTAGVQPQQPGIQSEEMNGVGE